MKFSEIIDQAGELLRRTGRLTYRSLKLEFDLDDKRLDVLKEELLFAHPEISEADGRGLVWTEEQESQGSRESIEGPTLRYPHKMPFKYT